jgi:hypothetical protein
MKKNLFKWVIGIIVVTYFSGCDKAEIKETATTNKNKDAKAALTESTSSCPGCYDYNATQFSGINTETALQLSHSYQYMNQPLLEISPGVPDALNAWFSLETLKSFIWKIEKAACEKGCAGNLRLGIRIYYGRYPTVDSMNANDDLASLNDGFAEHHTLFMVPTFRLGSHNWDFDPWHWGNNSGCTPKTMKQWFARGIKRPFGNQKSLIFSLKELQYFRNEDGSLTAGMNHGDLIPPSPPDGSAYNE